LRAVVRRHLQLTSQFVAWLRADSRFEIVAPVSLNLVCFRLKGPDSANEALLHKLNASGRLFLSHTKLNGKFVLRLCIGQSYTDEEHVRAAWQQIQKHATEPAVAAG
jgi:aromatic-L-amino-acid decarboxylase